MKNVEMHLLNLFPKNMEKTRRMHVNGVLSKDEYSKVLKTGDELIDIVRILEVRMIHTNTFNSYLEFVDKIERLLKEYDYYLELLIKKYNKVENVEHSYYTLLSQISRLQEKAGKRRNG